MKIWILGFGIYEIYEVNSSIKYDNAVSDCHSWKLVQSSSTMDNEGFDTNLDLEEDFGKLNSPISPASPRKSVRFRIPGETSKSAVDPSKIETNDK